MISPKDPPTPPTAPAESGEKTPGQVNFETFVGDWIGYTWDLVNPERRDRWERAAAASAARANAELVEALADAKALLNRIALQRSTRGPIATQAQQMAHRLASLQPKKEG